MKNPQSATTLKDMFAWQKDLLVDYMKIEELPQYPLEDLSLRENQKILKDFSGRIIEELAEGFECAVAAFEMGSHNQIVKAKRMVEEYNREMGDVWCFYLELLLYSGVDHSELQQWLENFSRENPGYSINPDNPLTSILWVCGFLNQEQLPSINHSLCFRIYTVEEIFGMDRPELMGAHELSQPMIDEAARLCWYTTFALKEAMNFLKSKAWARNEHQVNLISYQGALIDSFIMFIRYNMYMGKQEVSIYNTYIEAYNKNKKRIKDGY